MTTPTSTQQWGQFEFSLPGPTDGNPFLDVSFGARFQHRHRVVDVDGFYDGDGVYRVRFMPDAQGEWQFVTHSNVAALDGASGGFDCVAPAAGNHGPVSVRNGYHFAYADGTPFWQMGTTCYVWTHQGDTLEQQTLDTLKSAPFNKIRMCVFPKRYTYNQNEPPLYPFEAAPAGAGAGRWDFARFNPAFFRHFEKRVGDLRALGIEADIILFHPYDGGTWGFDTMSAEVNERYLRYLISRLAAYRNVWWSLANEWNLTDKPAAEWDRLFKIVQDRDPYGHLRSLHNLTRLNAHDYWEFYDHTRPWVTHCSIQHAYLSLVNTWRELYRKPVVMDECCYEGNIPNGWGNLSAREMVHRFWEGTCRGGYVGHGETYLDPSDVLWWSKGSVLRGQSAPRIAFLRRILEASGTHGLDPVRISPEHGFAQAGQPGRFYLLYTGWHQPHRIDFNLPTGTRYTADVIDPWEMTVTPCEGAFEGQFSITLPDRPYMAVRLHAAGS